MTDTKKGNDIDYALENQIGHLLRRAYQRHTSIFQSTIPDDHLTTVQFAVLVTIHDEGEGSLMHIGRLTAIDHATLRGITSRLRQRGLIHIRSNPDDGRERLLSLLPAGEKLVKQYIPAAQRISELTLAPLNECEQIAALHVLTKLANG